MVSLEIAALVLTGLGLTASIVYYSSVLSNANKTQQMQLETRQAQFYMQFHDKWTQEYIQTHMEILEKWEWSSYEDFMTKYGPETENWTKFMIVIAPYENMGLLVYNGLADPKLVWQWTSNMLIYLWEKMEPIFREYREQTGSEMMLWWTEELYYFLRKERELDLKDHMSRMERMEKQRKERGSLRAVSPYGFSEEPNR